MIDRPVARARVSPTGVVVKTSLSNLIERCRAGDSAAVRQLVCEFQGQVFGLCFRMLRQRQDAEDMAQETFVRALRSLDSFDNSREFEPWLLAIAGNRCRTMLAKRMYRPRPITLEEDYADARHDRSAEDLNEEVDLCLDNLRDEYRQAFLLFHEQQLSYAEIGEILDCPLGTVKTWVHRARQELITQLRARGVVAENRHAAN